MRRRDFIKGIVGSATAWPLTTRAQQRVKRRVAVLMGGLFSNDWGGRAEAAALESGLTELGWKLGGNIELEYRWPGAELDCGSATYRCRRPTNLLCQSISEPPEPSALPCHQT
jgi:hypothetical protein